MVAKELTRHSWLFIIWFWPNPWKHPLDAELHYWSRECPTHHVLTPWRICWINYNWAFWSPRTAAKVHGARKSCFANRSRIKCRERSVAVGASSEWCRKLLWISSVYNLTSTRFSYSVDPKSNYLRRRRFCKRCQNDASVANGRRPQVLRILGSTVIVVR